MRYETRRRREMDPIDVLKEDLAALRRDFADIAGQQAGRAREATREAVNTTAESAREFVNGARHKAEDAQHRLEGFAGHRPLTTIAMSLAAGLIIGKIMSWTSRR